MACVYAGRERLDNAPDVGVTYGQHQALDYLRAIREDRSLSPSEKLVATIVASHAGPDGKDAHPGEKLLAAETGLSRRPSGSTCTACVKKAGC